MQVHDLPYTDNPLPLYAQRITQPYGFALTGGRYTIIGWDPLCVITQGEDPFQLMEDLTPELQSPISPCGGWYGFLGYELAERLHTHLPPRERDLPIPDLCMGLYDRVVVFDHENRSAYEVKHEINLDKIPAQEPVSFNVPNNHARADKQGTSYQAYQASFNQIQAALVQGDCYQVNLAQRFSSPFEGSAWDSFLTLMKINPAPFAAYYQYPQVAILSCSPERFIRIDQRQIETKPIKGTAPRSSDPQLDRQAAENLSRSEKNRAENLMIVDLMRNDMGKICVPGSIEVPGLFEVESYPSVHHLVSTVTGVLRPEIGPLKALKSCFPGGSITGAPKLAAMQLIRVLEPHARHVYCGCMGYSDLSGVLDMNIAIRTALIVDGRAYLWAGGGIVLDSSCEAEYQECFDKVEPFFNFVI